MAEKFHFTTFQSHLRVASP